MKDLWTVKYRPQKLEDIVGNGESVNSLVRLVDSGNLPHLVFHGPVNSGKSSTAFALAYELYGEYYENNFTYFNGSDFFDQGKRYLVRDKRFVHIIGTDDPKKIYSSVISIFKEVINEFAGMGSLDADYKIIFIDNVESLETSAQHALRRMMEKYTRTCRFILSTTQPSKLIAPLRSRGLELFFTYVPDDALRAFVISVAEKEGISISDDGYDALLYYAGGNVSKALLTLQFAVMNHPGKTITGDLLYEEALVDVSKNVTELHNAAIEHDILNARKLIDTLLIEEGFTGGEVLQQLHSVVVGSGRGEDGVARAICRIADTDAMVIDSANPRIHLEKLVLELY
ncbi:MAG: AAA family ATPase [Methanococcoides sp.]|jgi:replication factor C small subunit|uniref:Replication factor C small subunit n=1 Tax=Methanococcoides seepicolus TaxID=2828780 RepID=A0A9E5DAZ1_9EURY|nr:AAA family ATPase [Methanococcoides seepicolus]MCM1985509.1 AAA family ATPase [Methanococcoides seepicolus]NOQ47718.1 AAA family ATPase [Methanococcoides sp.]